MTKARANKKAKIQGKVDQKAKPEKKTEPQPLENLVLSPTAFLAESANEVFIFFGQVEWKHNVLRSLALAAKARGDANLLQESTEQADAAFQELLKLTAVQCPYCKSPQPILNLEHLSNCGKMQSAHAGHPERWTLEQCLIDFPGIQTKSWLRSYVEHLEAQRDAAIATRETKEAEATAQPGRPAVTDKRKDLNPRGKSMLAGTIQQTPAGPTVPAVSSKKTFTSRLGRR
jgi:hypothetical protein